MRGIFKLLWTNIQSFKTRLERYSGKSDAAVRFKGLLCVDFNVLNLACTYRHWQAVGAQAFKVRDDGLTHFELDLSNGCPGSHAPG